MKKSPGMQFGKIFMLLILAGYLFCGVSDSFAKENLKIAIVDYGEIIRSYKKSEKVYNQLKKEVEKKQKKIDKSKQEVIKIRAKLGKEIDSLNEKEKQKKRKILENKLVNLQEMVKKSNQELQEMDRNIQAELSEEINAAVKAVAEKNNWNLVIRRKGIIIYHRQQNDITDKVITHLNKKGKK